MRDESPFTLQRALRVTLFVATAALAALALRGAWDHPWFALGVLGGLATYVGIRYLVYRRLVNSLQKGNVNDALKHWTRSVDKIPHAETMMPLLNATALAAFGRLEEARTMMKQAERGPAWEAALEHRLFVDVLLSTFEGDFDQAERSAARLNALPLPDDGKLDPKVKVLREAITALTRAFAHRPMPGDYLRLMAASERSPLVHWAMRYAAAIVAIDQGEPHQARELIANAPSWPDASAFRSFHDELIGYLDAHAR